MVVLAQSLTSGAAGWPIVVASVALVVLTFIVFRWLRTGLERDLTEAVVRAAVQLLAVGAVFAVIFESPARWLWSWAWVAVMVVAATVSILRRASFRFRGLVLVAGGSLAASVGLSLGLTFALGVVEYEPVSLVVIAGITIGNAVPSAVQGVDLTVARCRESVGSIEGLLSLGSEQQAVVHLVASQAARTALVAQVERTKVVGLIALPGAMTGLLLAGVDPVEAVALQILVMYLVLMTAAVCVAATVVAVTRSALTRDLRVADWVRTDPRDRNGGRRKAAKAG